MDKQDSNYSGHRWGANQEHISVLELLCGAEFEDEAVVYTRLSPYKNVASEQEEVQKQHTEYAAKLEPKNCLSDIMVSNLRCNLQKRGVHLPEHGIDCFHVHRVWLRSIHSCNMSHDNISYKECYEAPSEQSWPLIRQKQGISLSFILNFILKYYLFMGHKFWKLDPL